MIEANATVVMPLMFPALYRISKEHWNQSILTLVFNVLKVFMDMNAKLFDELTNTYKNTLIVEMNKEKEREELWKKLDKLEMSRSAATTKRTSGGGRKT